MKVILNWEKPFDITVELTSCKGDIKIGEGMLVNDMYAIKNYVRACEIAEYIKDNYESETDARAIELGIEVRDLMLDDEIPEDEAICEIQRGVLVFVCARPVPVRGLLPAPARQACRLHCGQHCFGTSLIRVLQLRDEL